MDLDPKLQTAPEAIWGSRLILRSALTFFTHSKIGLGTCKSAFVPVSTAPHLPQREFQSWIPQSPPTKICWTRSFAGRYETV